MGKENKSLFGEETQHESFGMLRFSRVQGYSGNLFGTDLVSNHYVIMELSNGTLKRSLSQDWYFSGQRKLQVKMSSNQFAELITSLNYGSGVPCTIETFNGERISQVDTTESKREATKRQFNEEIKDRISEIEKSTSSILTILNEKKTLNKADREELSSLLRKVNSTFKDAIPFYANQFAESMDKIVLEAKTEIENAIQSKITNAGLEKLGLESPQLKEIE